jgi:hypothetical protein
MSTALEKRVLTALASDSVASADLPGKDRGRASFEPHENGTSGKPLRRQLVRPSVVIGGRARRLTFCRSLRVVGGFLA